ncbi:GNAT family N-acetyltransferase [Xanthobacter sp. V4C-4]|uniref:GNAT family N-acetyltransferase n=1 Tax=Xanthobacter cornucopiae TaxID=3119924 RepID=UPI00372A2C8A
MGWTVDVEPEPFAIAFRGLELGDADTLAVLLASYGEALRHAGPSRSFPDPARPRPAADPAGGAPVEAGAASRLLEDPMAEVLGAFLGGRLVAFAVFFDLPEAISGRRAGQIDDLYVAPEARGRRLAQGLIEAIAARGRARGWVHVRWLAPPDQEAAQRAYARFATPAPWSSHVLWLTDGERW